MCTRAYGEVYCGQHDLKLHVCWVKTYPRPAVLGICARPVSGQQCIVYHFMLS